jgi:putative copper export protein
MVVDTAVYTLHTAFAALWAGSVLFVVTAVQPLAMDGDIPPDAYGRVVSTLQWVTRLSALLLLVTGGHMAQSGYTAATLTGTMGGYLVVTMLGLWLVLTAMLEVGTARALRGVDDRKIREPAREARPFFGAAAVVAVGLLVVAGLLGRTPAAL